MSSQAPFVARAGHSDAALTLHCAPLRAANQEARPGTSRRYRRCRLLRDARGRLYAAFVPLPPVHTGGTALVTGASSGIGAEIARELARRGYGLVLVARRADRLQALADELVESRAMRVEVVVADLADEEERAELVRTIERAGLQVDVLVNNAGASTWGPVHEARRAPELTLVRTDVEAVVDLCTMIVPGMVARRSGAVLTTASTAAFQPLPRQASYGAAKAFVLSYSYALRAELRRFGIPVTALCPGPVATGFATAAGTTERALAGMLPRAMWMAAREVARAGVDGLARDRAVVVPGLLNRLASLVASATPASVSAGALERVRQPRRRRP